MVGDVRASDVIDHKEEEFRFIREVIYNYLDTVVKRDRRQWSASKHKNKIIEEQEESME